MNDPDNTSRLYGDLAWLWPMWGSPGEYAAYCGHVVRLMREHTQIPIRSLLNIGCGGGKNVFNLKRDFSVTGLDLSPRMLELAQELNPECEFLQGDMRIFALGRTFDAVLVDDAISYMTTRADLRSAFVAAWQHLNPGGVMVVNPDDTKETFVQNCTVVTPAATETKPADVDVVFVENIYDPEPEDDHYEGTMVYLIRQDGKLRVEIDRHVLGLFSLQVWRDTLTEVGFRIFEGAYAEQGKEYNTFACLKPGWPSLGGGPQPVFLGGPGR
jgi:SAM-dependent methyltransferase